MKNKHIIFGIILLLIACVIWLQTTLSNSSANIDVFQNHSYQLDNQDDGNSKERSNKSDNSADSVYQRALLASQAGTQRMIDLGLVRGSNDVSINLMDNDFILNEEALKYAGIPLSDKDKVQSVFDNLMANCSEEFAKCAKLNTKLSDETKGIYVYDILANEENGISSIKAKTYEVLAEMYGSKSAKMLENCRYGVAKFGNFGKLNVRLTLQKAKNTNYGNADSVSVKYTASDPLTGQSVIGGVDGGIDTLREISGNSFDISSLIK